VLSFNGSKEGAGQYREATAMKVATYRVGGERRVGVVDERRQTVSPFDLPEAEAALGVIALTERAHLPRLLSPMPLGEAVLEAPVPRPRRNVYCVGKNYHEHAEEFAASGFDSSAREGAVPKHPIIFSKVPDCVIAHRDPVSIDRNVSQAIDYEAELGVIIGKGGRGIKAANALDHVWGYTIINDVTARDLQGLYSQWLIGKSQDTFCPMGPWAVTRDEIDLKDTRIQCWINGELRQNANTRDLIFDVPTIIETISAGVTLMPGDVIATGTPAGVGIGFKPPKYPVPGDVARIEISGIGVLENEFREARS
jgi:2-keto-4-pentenoate hydratase/2-oxohepta-3-ene-1,7-dioic acid hydratase in catechol pathway